MSVYMRSKSFIKFTSVHAPVTADMCPVSMSSLPWAALLFPCPMVHRLPEMPSGLSLGSYFFRDAVDWGVKLSGVEWASTNVQAQFGYKGIYLSYTTFSILKGLTLIKTMTSFKENHIDVLPDGIMKTSEEAWYQIFCTQTCAVQDGVHWKD